MNGDTGRDGAAKRGFICGPSPPANAHTDNSVITNATASKTHQMSVFAKCPQLFLSALSKGEDKADFVTKVQQDSVQVLYAVFVVVDSFCTF